MNEASTYLRRALEAARVLLVAGHYGDSVSRSYYAMFHAARGALLSKGVSAKTHKGVHTQFNKMLIKDGTLPRHVAHSLRSTFELWQAVDYDIEALISEDVATEVVSKATAFLEAIERLLAE